MRFSELIKRAGLKVYFEADDFKVKGITYDSRKVQDGYIFAAVAGYKEDGSKYIDEAVSKGAKAILTDSMNVEKPKEAKVNVIASDNVRRDIAVLSREYWGHPDMQLFGITGTNGKTTVSYLMKKIYETAGKKTSVLGTNGYIVGDRQIESKLTTPDSPEIYSMLSDNDSDACFMEVSSIALDLYRVYGLRFDCAVFTNLTSEHLDFHLTMDNYFGAKKKLFDGLDENAIAVSNIDDEYGERILAGTKARKIFYGIEKDVDYKAENVRMTLENTEFTIKYKKGSIDIKSIVTGRFNVYNMLAAAAGMLESGVCEEDVKRGLESFEAVSGRFNTVKLPNGAYAVVDYSHTSDSLKNAIETSREVVQKGRIITVFGCGGNRDRTKRPVMGKYATELSDYSIVTSDNPRYEEPMDIIDEVLSGISKDSKYEIEADREKAIAKAVEISQEGDIILICGKGHETYQEIKGIRTHFDDKEIVEKYAQNLLHQSN